MKINAENLFTFDNTVRARGRRRSRAGAHTVELRKTRHGPALLQRLPDQLHARRPHHEGRPGGQGRAQVLQADAGRQDGRRRRRPRAGGEPEGREVRAQRNWRTWRTLKSGDLVEIELEIDSKNDYEYLLFEDMKAAGFEPVDVRSGYNGNELGAYVELRDDRVSLLRAQPRPRQAQRQLPPAGRDPRQVQRPADEGLGDVRPGAAGEFGRAEAEDCGYAARKQSAC